MMHIKEMKELINKLEETERALMTVNELPYSKEIKACIVDALLQRKNTLLERIKSDGVQVDEYV